MWRYWRDTNDTLKYIWVLLILKFRVYQEKFFKIWKYHKVKNKLLLNLKTSEC